MAGAPHILAATGLIPYGTGVGWALGRIWNHSRGLVTAWQNPDLSGKSGGGMGTGGGTS